MTAFADARTLEDLGISGRHRRHSVRALFDRTVTARGGRQMDALFAQSLRDPEAINQRSAVYRYFAAWPEGFPLAAEAWERMEAYLAERAGGALKLAATTVSKRVLQAFVHSPDYRALQASVATTLEGLSRLHAFVGQMPEGNGAWAQGRGRLRQILSLPALARWRARDPTQAWSMPALMACDHLLRVRLRDVMSELMDLLVELDVCMAVGRVAREHDLGFADAEPRGHQVLQLVDFRHPAVPHGVANSLSLSGPIHALFLTGANMAGKSTLMKAFGICLYLAHMGFPVPARQMRFPVKDGVCTSINLPDDLQSGYSHFYAEVQRVRSVAEQIALGRDLVVVFDELFKGTNVKDASEATLAITEAFGQIRGCCFLVSTHIVEVAETLRERCSHFAFRYLPTQLDAGVPHYTYVLAEGVAQDRQGMRLVEQEGILAMLQPGGVQR